MSSVLVNAMKSGGLTGSLKANKAEGVKILKSLGRDDATLHRLLGAHYDRIVSAVGYREANTPPESRKTKAPPEDLHSDAPPNKKQRTTG